MLHLNLIFSRDTTPPLWKWDIDNPKIFRVSHRRKKYDGDFIESSRERETRESRIVAFYRESRRDLSGTYRERVD